MLLGHNWVTNGSYLQRQISCKSDIAMSDYTAQESARKGVIFKSKRVFNEVNKKYVDFGDFSGETTQKTTQKTTKKIISVMRENPGITREELATILKSSLGR